jgi:hypothetical protein
MLQMLPGQVKWLTEQPMFFISGIWTSSLVKLYHFGAVRLGLVKGWKGAGEQQQQQQQQWDAALKSLMQCYATAAPQWQWEQIMLRLTGVAWADRERNNTKGWYFFKWTFII